MKHQTATDKYLNQIVWYAGLPLRRGDVLIYLGEIARSLDKENWLRLRDAGIMGTNQSNDMHGYPPEGTDPLSLEEFKKIMNNYA